MGCQFHPWPLPGFHPEAPIPRECPACADERIAQFDAHSNRTPDDIAHERYTDIIRKRATLPARERRALREQGV